MYKSRQHVIEKKKQGRDLPITKKSRVVWLLFAMQKFRKSFSLLYQK